MKIVVIVVVALLIILRVIAVIRYRETHKIDRRTVTTFDLQRYLGMWYEIARYNHRFERGLADVTACYRMREDGLIEVDNSGVDARTGRHRMARGKAKPGRQSGQLRVAFFWNFYADYNVLELADDYSWALVGSRSPRYLWILARTPHLPEQVLSDILELAERRGYSTSELHFVGQSDTLHDPC